MNGNTYRTNDVISKEKLTFEDLKIPTNILKGLTEYGFINPSPIQVEAIPIGRFGSDVIAQAKAGTGKTCVFGICILESIEPNNRIPQSLILCPTREIAIQTYDFICNIGKYIDKLKCCCIIGGLNTSKQIEELKLGCQVIIGTPGRILTIFKEYKININNIKYVVLDEADILLNYQFYDIINEIMSALPEHRQVFALSATYPSDLLLLTKSFMRNPIHIKLYNDDESSGSDICLEGVKQYYINLKTNEMGEKSVFKLKIKEILRILSEIKFYQCIIFVNNKDTAKDLNQYINTSGYPSIYMNSTQTQSSRTQSLRNLQQFKCRVIICTDLLCRGIDIQKITCVINYDPPKSPEIYLHRIGRCGRFGTYGTSILLLVNNESEIIDKYNNTIGSILTEYKSELVNSDLLIQLNESDKELLNQYTNQEIEKKSQLSEDPFKFVNHPSMKLYKLK